MAEIDTSSYPKAPTTSFLDTAQKYQTLESNKLSIDQNKLKLANDNLTSLSKIISDLTGDPEVTGDNANPAVANQKIKTQAIYAAKQLGIPDAMRDNFIAQNFPLGKDVGEIRKQFDNVVNHLRTTQEMINYHYGSPGLMDTGQQTIPIVSSPKFGVRGTGAGIQNQLPVNTPTIDNDPNSPTYGQPKLLGPVPAVAAPGAVTAPPMRSNIGGLPVADKPLGPNFRSNTTQDIPNNVVTNRFPAAAGPTTGMPPLFDEGKKAFTEDQARGSALMSAAKPAIQALPLIQAKGFLSGPLTEQFTNAVATLKSTGLISQADENDPTAIRQEVNKKLAQYVSSSPVGQRSDAAQALKDAASPSAKVQILPALVKLTKDAIALDRVQAAMPNAFKDRDLSKYGNHRSTFPQSIDERAFGLDLEPEEKGSKMVDDMAKKLKSKSFREKKEAEKFFRSLAIADKLYYQ